MLFPVSVDVPMSRWPWMNWVLLGLLFIAHIWALSDPYTAARFIMGIEEFDPDIEEYSLSLIGHMFLHGDWLHLFGNMLFMWVFGNAVCAKIGNVFYPLLWIGSGIISGLAEPYGLGASGAINGIVGFYLMMYPTNDITMFYWLFIRVGTFELSSYWMILLWLAFDLFGMMSGAEDVAYLSHVAGLGTGIAAALVVLKLRWIEPDDDERTILDILAERRAGPHRRGRSPSPGPVVSRAGVVLNTIRLHVKLPNGQVKHLPLHEFMRHEQQGKPVNQFEVSEDGQRWTTFGQWRQRHGA